MKMEKTISELQAELETIIEWFSSGDVDIDEATSKYERGLELIALLQKRLTAAENNITKLKQAFDKV
jgi:exodeoxyribonuclease VII small subunit